MQNYNKQNGASMPLVIIFLGMAMILLTISYKLYDAYYDNWLINKVMEGFEKEPGLEDLTIRDIRILFEKRLATNSVRNFDASEGLSIKKSDGVLTMDIDYEVRVNIYNNIDAVVSFQSNFEREL